MQGKTIAILENRMGEQMAGFVTKQGGIVFSAPALSECPEIDPALIVELLKRWEAEQPDFFIFQTGSGVKALFEATDSMGLTASLIDRIHQATVIVRSPKPAGALRSRRIRIDVSAKNPHTTSEVLFEMNAFDLQGRHVVVQRYGDTNLELQRTLEERGAAVTEIASYRWGLPENIQPLLDLIEALEQQKIEAVAFTSASQVHNLFKVAHQEGKHQSLLENLNRSVVASIGPVCTAALNRLGIQVHIEPNPPKLGPFIAKIKDHFSSNP
jgi:uroporphyrinogen-III synthase